MKKQALCLISILTMVSCGLFDVESAESKNIVGNIFVGNSHLPEDSGFYVFYRMPNRDRMILKDDEYVDYLISDDSIGYQVR